MKVTPLQIAAWVELAICWIAWSMAFVKPRKRAQGQKRSVRASSSRWGVLLVMCGYGCVWAFVMPKDFEKSTASLIASMLVAPPSVALVWMATRHLDKQWRVEAALSEDHKLITSGPYRWIRNPIYASMLGMLLATGCSKTWWPLLVAGVILFIVGTEIRVRAEEQLLSDRFGDEFEPYKATTPASLPFVR
ncbi:methyltransferase family protein [Occallatibacter savannae]|uniref:methyltransferase family protein n=1 Tax=Occallatibacter savannae TaxID=1002691 RepID=UPI000D69E2C5|nr:isoprenylcysteine carboxylmethyltransferase family protein [Occallatibacter savannae]